MRRDCRPGPKAHPTQRRAGAGRPLLRGPRELGAAPEPRMSLGSRAPAPGWGRGWPKIRVGAARALLRARAPACFYSRARARCAALLGRVATDVRVLVSDISALGAVANERSGFRGASPPATPSFRARALLLGRDAASRARRTPLLRLGAAGWRLAAC